jgi:hypothetical protein
LGAASWAALNFVLNLGELNRSKEFVKKFVPTAVDFDRPIICTDDDHWFDIETDRANSYRRSHEEYYSIHVGGPPHTLGISLEGSEAEVTSAFAAVPMASEPENIQTWKCKVLAKTRSFLLLQRFGTLPSLSSEPQIGDETFRAMVISVNANSGTFLVTVIDNDEVTFPNNLGGSVWWGTCTNEPR